MLLKVLALWFVISGVMIILYARRELVATWLEPVLRRPVLIIESDDWGAGPVNQSGVLGEIARILANFSDCEGRKPVMTLGMILATADRDKIKASGSYHRILISEPVYRALLDSIENGVETGVFTIQLHGMEHYWPPALMAAIKTDEAVGIWLEHAPQASTEDLPSPIQSRWVDASLLPSVPLVATDIKQAVQEEVDAFQAIFGVIPKVVVPPTFVWNKVVEQAWAESGINVIITPGRRFEMRDEAGRPARAGQSIYNGQSGENGIVYLVRDTYFEPSLGHTAAQALTAFASKVQLGRPALFETHRFNFLDKNKNLSLGEMESLLRGAVKKYTHLAFLSTDKLARFLKNRDPKWVEKSLRRRVHVWINRLGEFHRLRKLTWVTGWIVPVWLVWKLTR